MGIGAIVGALATARRGHAPGRARLMLIAFAAFGVLTVGASLSRWQWLSMLLLVGTGFMLTTAFSTLNSLVQEMAPDALRGRVLSIFGVAFRGGGPVGSLLAGLPDPARGRAGRDGGLRRDARRDRRRAAAAPIRAS